jgi:hypothetical protein
LLIVRILIVLLLSVGASANESLFLSHEWNYLLRYHSNTSLADSPNFFVHPEGKSSPKKEYFAFLKKVQNKDLKSICQFPARYMFLKRNLKYTPDINLLVSCPKLRGFYQKLQAKHISLVFSSYYIENPASIFGHTFLKLSKEKDSGLLSYGFSYSATIDKNDDPFSYMYKGLTGGYKGNFSLTPYYHKVREYNDYELRDMWEYDLKLAQSEVDLLVYHLWELQNSWFNYYYLDENCSYHILYAIQAIKPDWKLIDKTSLMTVPVETIKKVSPYTSQIKLRPSLFKKARQRLSLLNKSERKTFKRLIRNKNNIVLEQNPKVLDAAIDFMDYKYGTNEDESFKLKSSLLSARSKVNTPPIELKVDDSNPPHLSQSFIKVDINAGSFESTSFAEIGLRPLLLDLSERQDGQPKDMSIHTLNTRLRIVDGSIKMHQLSFIKLENLRHFDRYFKNTVQ